jgi:hypothetical protein
MYLKIDNMKVPCIKYNPENWEYIKSTLETFGYSITNLDGWKYYPYITLNLGGTIGQLSNITEAAASDIHYNREIITNIEEFLERAAILIGKQYKRKNMIKINGIEIKPGMVLTDSNDEKYVVFPAKDYLAVIIFNDDRRDFSGWIDYNIL